VHFAGISCERATLKPAKKDPGLKIQNFLAKQLNLNLAAVAWLH
jgi:hypothetical protein